MGQNGVHWPMFFLIVSTTFLSLVYIMQFGGRVIKMAFHLFSFFVLNILFIVINEKKRRISCGQFLGNS